MISNFRLGIGFPLSFHMIPSAFFMSYEAMEKPPYILFRTSNGPIDEMRNSIVRQALEEGCTHLMMCDTDQVYHPKTLTSLLSHKLPMVGCLVYRRYPPFDPLMLRGSVGKYETIDEWEPNSLVEVDATGAGCLLFNMRVFRNMPEPWFRTRKHKGKPVGEDIGFCSDLKAAGYKIYVDTGVPAGHISQVTVTEPLWRVYKKIQEADAHSIEHGVLTMEPQ